MKQILWDADKNAALLRERGVCFEDVVLALERGALLDNLEHPNREKYPGQRMLVVDIGDYAWLVPFIETDEYLLLKTVIPSRKATRKYLAGGATEHEADE